MEDLTNQESQSSQDAVADPNLTGTDAGQTEEKRIKRGEPDISESRRRLVSWWVQQIQADKKHWKNAFNQMRRDQDFAYGKQWSDSDWEDNRYQANITLRHIQQRVAALYARNPKVKATRKERMMSSVWDGTMSSVMLAMQQVQMMQQQMQQAMALGGGDPMMMEQAQAAMMGPTQILQDAQQSVEYRAQMDKFAKTLELVYNHNVEEQVHPFKAMMKLVVRRAVTTGVGYIKVGYQRVMQQSPEVEAQIADASQRLATLERLMADFADGEITDEHAKEKESVKLLMQDLQQQQDVLVREGLIFDYPMSTSVIPDRKTQQLREFLGSDHVTQEYVLSPDEVKEIYGVDIGEQFKAYRPGTTEDPTVSPLSGEYDEVTDCWTYDKEDTQSDGYKNRVAVVWETYCRKDGLVYVTCDGYKDFLQEPKSPDVWTERFYPWFPLVLNECDHPQRIFPPSDVGLLRDMQREYNRLRESMREHRISNRPATAVAQGSLSESDVDKMIHRPSNALIEIAGLQPGQAVDQVMQPIRHPGLDPNLYEVNPIFEDVLRTVGVQEANLGGMGGGTATESSIAESSRQSSLASNVDDLDEMLTEVAKASGQILMKETSEETVKKIVGPGAVWPELSRQDLAEEVYLGIEAGSTGKPNQAQEIQNFERMAPILMQVPGISPELMAKEGIRRLDDRLELDELYDQNALSIQAMNQQAGSAMPGGAAGTDPNDPAAQGAEGAENAEQAGAPPGASSAGTNPQMMQ